MLVRMARPPTIEGTMIAAFASGWLDGSVSVEATDVVEKGPTVIELRLADSRLDAVGVGGGEFDSVE
jgi:hypothetical protein